jgi:ATP-dependent Lon protease
MPGKGNLILTGQLGDVMKESAQAARSYARAHANDFNIPAKIFTQYDLHIHVPAGGVPKDGPSAGITMLTAILSVLTQRPINSHYAMTGELNLRGEVMPIGGVKEKILAAKRNKMTHVILPYKNRHDLTGIEDIAHDIGVIWVHHAKEVLDHVLMPVEAARVA